MTEAKELTEVQELIQAKDLIQVTQLPIIVEQLEQLKQRIAKRVNYALSLECTEDTYKEVKEIRAELNKEFKDVEAVRIAIKKQILQPYEEFEKIYKSCVTDIFKPADEKLAEQINIVTDGIKQEKINMAKEYFAEYTKSKHIDFVSFEQLNLNITMNISNKKIKETISAFIDKVCDDIAMIDTQDHRDEIFVEYKKSLNVSQAILLVKNRYQEIEEARARQAAARAKAEEEAKAAALVEEAIEEEQQELFAPEVITKTFSEPDVQPIPRYSTAFRINNATLGQLKELKRFLKSGGYEYEQLG